jgi:hypothetical protein
MKIEELTKMIVDGLLRPSQRIPDDYAFVCDVLKRVRNAALDEAARVAVIGKKEVHHIGKEYYQQGWFDGVEDCQKAIEALKTKL